MTEGIRVNRVLDKSFGYGIVLSGAAANVKKRFDDYISNNINQILEIIEKDTRKLSVREIVVFLIRLLKLTPLEYPNRCVSCAKKHFTLKDWTGQQPIRARDFSGFLRITDRKN